MAFTEADRVQIRKFLGFASLYLQKDPRLESAITAIQSLADGGSQPTSDAETEVKTLIYGAAAVVGPPALPARQGLVQIESAIANQYIRAGVETVGRDAVRIDPSRGVALLRAEGRRLVGQLARMLDTYPRTDAFSTPPMLDDQYPDYPRSPY